MKARLQTSGRATGYSLIILGSTFAGSLGIFYHIISSRFGASAESMVLARTCVSLSVLLVALLGWQRYLLQLTRKSLPALLAFGFFGQAFYSWAYARSIMAVGVSIAALMTYSALIWVTLYEWVSLRIRPDRLKALAMVVAFAGVFLIMRVQDTQSAPLSPAAVGISVMSGIAGALWTVLNKRAGEHSNPQLVVAFGLTVSALVIGSTLDLRTVFRLVATPGAAAWLIALGVGPALLGPLLWAVGLRRISASDASIVGAWEPLMACLLGFLVLGERLTTLQLVGALAIVASILLLGSRRAAPHSLRTSDSFETRRSKNG